MSAIRHLIDDFKNADQERQLYLFLTYRDLRSEFMEIIQEQNNQKEMLSGKDTQTSARDTDGIIKKCVTAICG